MLITIILSVLIIIILLFIARLNSNAKYIANKFATSNTLTWGPKRSGKGLLWQKVINIRKKPYYYINTDYGKKSQSLTIADMTIAPNSWTDFINGTIKEIPRLFIENKDIFIDDGGNYLPSFAHKDITKAFPHLPSFLMLQGHIADSNTHVNYNGAFTRLYDKVREQADNFFNIKGRIILFNYLFFVKVRYYEMSTTAEMGLLPYKKNGLLDFKANKALRQQYYATNGLIKDMWICITNRGLTYDTRAYEKTLFGCQVRIYSDKPKKHRFKVIKFIVSKIKGLIKSIKKG